MSSPAPATNVLACIECGVVSTATSSTRGWRGYRCDDPDRFEPPALAFYCLECAVAEFGPAPSGRRA